MSLEAARREVVQEIATAQEAMRESRTARVLGTYREKVTAAGEIELLKRQLAMLATRLAEIDSERSAKRSVIGWFRRVWFELRLHFENWIARAA